MSKKIFKVASRTLFSALLVSASVWAQEAAPSAAPGAAPDQMKGMLLQLPVFLAIFGLIYLGVIRPQRNLQKKQQDLVSSLKKGDEVVVSGGLIGTIRGLTDRVITLEIAPGTEVKVLRAQVQAYLKDTVTT